DQRAARLSDELLAHRHDDRAEFSIECFFGMVPHNAALDRVHVRLRLRYRNAGLQTRDDVQIMSAAIRHLFLVERDRNPQANFSVEKLKTRRHHTDDRILLSVEQNVAVDDVATDERLNTKQGEEVRRDGEGRDALRITVAGDVEADLGGCGHVCKRLVLVFPVEVVCGRGSVSREARERGVFPHDYELLRILELERPEQDGVHDAENGSIRSDAERERYESNDRKTGPFEQTSKAVTNVFK